MSGVAKSTVSKLKMGAAKLSGSKQKTENRGSSASSQLMIKMSAPGRLEVKSKVDLFSSESEPEKVKDRRSKKSPKLLDQKLAKKSPQAESSLKAEKTLQAKSKPKAQAKKKGKNSPKAKAKKSPAKKSPKQTPVRVLEKPNIEKRKSPDTWGKWALDLFKEFEEAAAENSQ